MNKKATYGKWRRKYFSHEIECSTNICYIWHRIPIIDFNLIYFDRPQRFSISVSQLQFHLGQVVFLEMDINWSGRSKIIWYTNLYNLYSLTWVLDYCANCFWLPNTWECVGNCCFNARDWTGMGWLRNRCWLGSDWKIVAFRRLNIASRMAQCSEIL